MKIDRHFQFVIIGSGPGGQKAAIQAAKAGRSVAVIERERDVGGACVHHGTIPSKTLRESAVNILHCRRSAALCDVHFRDNVKVENLMTHKTNVLRAHVAYMKDQLDSNTVTVIHGRGRFVTKSIVAVTKIDGSVQRIGADHIIIATGSTPRTPDNIPVDHEHILDSDSILSMIYLPESLTILGGGVIACEYASFFACLGVKVTVVDANARLLGFLDPEISDIFEHSMKEHEHCRLLSDRNIRTVEWDGVSCVTTTLEDGEGVTGEKMLVALGRTPNIRDLATDKADLNLTDRGQIIVNEHCQTNISHIYAVGDVIGFPALASCSMEQGRRAMCHALKVDPGGPFEFIPMGIYTIPEIASVGLTETKARAQYASVEVGYAPFDEVARAQISGTQDGLLKLIANTADRKLLGVHIIGDGATELIHMGQLALLAGFPIDVFIENVMNFPTLAEAYRIAALNLSNKIPKDTDLA